MVFSYGAFRLFAGGDFSDVPGPERADLVEDELAGCIQRCDVAKVDRHGHPPSAARSPRLRPRVWVACVRNLHLTEDSRVAARSGRAGRRTAPGRRSSPSTEAGERPWWRFVPDACRTGCHAVVTVPPGGETFRLPTCSTPAARGHARRRLAHLPHRALATAPVAHRAARATMRRASFVSPVDCRRAPPTIPNVRRGRRRRRPRSSSTSAAVSKKPPPSQSITKLASSRAGIRRGAAPAVSVPLSIDLRGVIDDMDPTTMPFGAQTAPFLRV